MIEHLPLFMLRIQQSQGSIPAGQDGIFGNAIRWGASWTYAADDH